MHKKYICVRAPDHGVAGQQLPGHLLLLQREGVAPQPGHGHTARATIIIIIIIIIIIVIITWRRPCAAGWTCPPPPPGPGRLSPAPQSRCSPSPGNMVTSNGI